MFVGYFKITNLDNQLTVMCTTRGEPVNQYLVPEAMCGIPAE